MKDEEKINPGHAGTRRILRTIGPFIAGVGLLLVVIGMISFFSAFGSFASPRYFWCAFVGIPLLGVGLMITKFAFLGRILRYQAGEIAPVGKDTFNYIAEGTTEGVRTMASAVGTGLSEGFSGETPRQLRCPQCNHENDADARFCDECGSRLVTSRRCPACNSPNDADAKFCDNCGQQFTNR